MSRWTVPLVAAGLVAFGALAAAEIASRMAAVHLVRAGELAAAVRLRPRDQDVREAASLAQLERGRPDAAIASARWAILAAPLSPYGYRQFGLAEEARGRLPEADALLGAAHSLSRWDSRTELWRMRRAFDQRRFDEASISAAALMRIDHDYATLVASLVLGAGPAAEPAMVDRMIASPTWRGVFFRRIAAADPGRGIALAEQLRERGAQLTLAEQRLAVRDVSSRRGPIAARRLLAAMDPASRAAVSDPEMRGVEGVPPFSWKLSSAGGASAAFGATGDPSVPRALVLEARGVVSRDRLAEQVIVLSPGRYRLTGEVLSRDGEQLPFRWAVDCRGGRRLVAVAPVAGRGWTDFSAPFEVPATCRVQVLAASSLSPDGGGVSAAFRNLNITPEPGE
jgi:hypothetical protein